MKDKSGLESVISGRQIGSGVFISRRPEEKSEIFQPVHSHSEKCKISSFPLSETK